MCSLAAVARAPLRCAAVNVRLLCIMSKCYKRVCTDIVDDEWHTVSVRRDSSVGEVLKALKVQGVDVVGKSIAEGNDLYSTVS